MTVDCTEKQTPCPHCDRMFATHRAVCDHIDTKHGRRKGRKYGKLGAASPVRQIDPSEYDA